MELNDTVHLIAAILRANVYMYMSVCACLSAVTSAYVCA